MTALMVVIFAIISSFISLQVQIDKQSLRLKFGYRIFKKSFALATIKSVKTVKNHRYHGWGIRLSLYPKIRIYNVAGFDAVEIQLQNGKRYRIGTDEPKKLEEALHNVIT
jgi:hypothetical protein